MGILFAILSAAFFGINNIIDKFLLDKNSISPTVVAIYGGIAAFLAGFVVVLITGFYPIDLKSFFIILLSGFLTTIYLLPYFKALKLDDASYVVPLFQFYPIIVLILGYIYFGESLSLVQIFGCIIVILAGILLSIDKFDRNIFRLRKSFFYMLISSILFADAQILYKFGVQEIPFWNTLPYEAFGISLGALVVYFYRKNSVVFFKETSKFKKEVFGYMTLNELVYLVSRYTGYFAISLISVGLVSVLAGLQSFFVLLYAVIISLWFPHVLKELVNRRVIAQKFISIFLMLVGLYFIFY